VFYNPGITASSEPRVLTVTQVNRLVAGMLAEHFSSIWISGEVSGLKSYPSGHLYFSLKDENSQIDAVCFRSSASKLKFRLEDGLEIVGRGRLDLYAPRGKYQVVLERIEPKGVGALQLAYEKLKKKLAGEGLFDEERKKPVPLLPRTVGIVTSPAGAAVHDMVRTMRLHRARFRVLLYPAQVQGEGAAEQVAEGVRVLNRLGNVDVIIVGRGGGSLEDLWAFNEEPVARAIAGSGVPVVSGVGHETDFTIADFAADFRAATPTAAAQHVSRGWEELDERLADAAGVLVRQVEQLMLDRERRLEELVRHRAFELVRSRLSEAGHRVARSLLRAESGLKSRVREPETRLDRLRERLARQHPAERIVQRRSRLARLGDRLGHAAQGRAERARVSLDRASVRLDALSPLASLGRGYAVCRKPDGTVVSSRRQAKAGERLDVRVSDGTIGCEVTETAPLDETGEGRR